MSDMIYKKNFKFYLLLILPAMALYLFALIIPLFTGTFPSSLYNWNIVKGVHNFIGLDNYKKVFTDPIFLHSLKFTSLLAVFSVIGSNIIAFLVAFLLDAKLFAKSVARSFFFIPNIMSGILVGFVWLYIFTGAIPDAAGQLGLTGLASVSWFGTDNMAMTSVIIVTIWYNTGFLMMLYIAGLQTVPEDVIEAARLDGCTGLKKIFKIQLPLIMHTITINLFISIAGAFKSMDVALALTKGGPGRATQTVAMTIYNEAFDSHRMGYASAQSVVLLLIVVVITVIQLWLTRRREVQM